MHKETGRIYSPKEMEALNKYFEGVETNPSNFSKEELEIARSEKENIVPIKRDLTEHEIMRKQIDLYSPCGCGSRKKFKFCCNK